MDLRNYPLDLQTCNVDLESCESSVASLRVLSLCTSVYSTVILSGLSSNVALNFWPHAETQQLAPLRL